jgi:hypothetical protein
VGVVRARVTAEFLWVNFWYSIGPVWGIVHVSALMVCASVCASCYTHEKRWCTGVFLIGF